MPKQSVENLTMGGPATYSIRVQGRLAPEWADRIEGMNITEDAAPGGSPVTVLVGRVRDQSALSGILNTLYELHLPVLSVDCLDKG